MYRDKPYTTPTSRLEPVIVRQEEFQLRVPRDPKRSGGLHLSTVLRKMALERRVLDAKYEEQGDLDKNIILQVGMAWEDFLARYQHPDIEYHPGEISLDGIAMSPDGISVVDSEDYAERIGVELDSWILHEFKATRKSSRGFEELLRTKAKKCLLWLWQVMAYRHALNKSAEMGMECYIAKLHILFLNGNYTFDGADPESQPSYKIYILEFTPDELESNWQMIRSYADSMEGLDGV